MKTFLQNIERYLLAFWILKFKFSIIFICRSVLLIVVQHTKDFDLNCVRSGGGQDGRDQGL
jgi:hypothetical protein